MLPKVAAAIYARISSDEDDDRLGVTRQIKDCTAEAKRRGWTIAEQYVDNDVSATRARVRREYQRMLADIAAGRITGLIVWDVDRLTRSPRELEDVIDLADRHHLQLVSIGGEIDLATPQGKMTARIKGSVARHESDQMSRRIKRKFLENAEAGAPHGMEAYGYRRVYDTDERGRRIDSHDELDHDQAAVIRDAASRFLNGESLRSIAADLNARHVPPPRRGAWSSTTLRQVLLRERNAGRRRHLGQVIGDANWPSVYDDPGFHDRVVAGLTDPTRRTNKGATRRHLLTGIARCGLDGCGMTVVVNVGRVSNGKRQPPAYVCGTCHRVRRKQADVDRTVEAVILARLKQPDALASLAQGDPLVIERARSEVAELEARLARAADDYADGAITGEQLRRITSRLRPKIDTERATIARSMPAPILPDLAGPEADSRWAAAPLDVKRALIELLVTVTIMPSGPGRAFDPELVRIDWQR